MSKPKEKEDQIGIIPENEYIPDLEKEVAYFAAMVPKPTFVSKKRYTPNKYPEKFKDSREELEYQIQEINRLTTGYDGLCGKGYGWLNYAKLRDPEKGKISPEFRAIQEQFFRKVEELQANPGRGLVGYKRRRIGFSNMEGWDVEHDCMTKPFFQVGMNSKSENDSRNLFKTVKFIHQNLPDWMRPKAVASDRRDFMHYAWYEKDAAGNKITKGLQSWISSVAPTDSAHEGQAYSKLLIDESGKIPNLLTIWQFAEDCLRINTRRVGLPIILGTVGDIDKDGKGLMELYLNSEAYQLDRFVFLGCNGLIVDEFGNDKITDSIRWVIYERERLKSANRKVRDAFIQKYPLCDQDAFNYVGAGGVGDIQLINEQILELTVNPPEKRVGWMRRKPDGGVDFVPNPDGKIIIYELPDPSRQNGYRAVVDPAEDDDVAKTRDTSELALVITARPYGVDPPKMAVEYADRPLKLDGFFEQTAMVLQWYNNTKFLPELNKGGWRMLKYFEQHYPHLLALAPKSANSAKKGVDMKHGVKMTEDRKSQLYGLADDYVDNYVKFIPSIKLLQQFKVVGDSHADDDVCIAFMWCLAVMQSDRSVVRNSNEVSDIPTTTLKKVNGVIQYHNQNKPVVQKPKYQSNSLLFRR